MGCETISFEYFLGIGITLVIFKESWKTPILQDKLSVSERYWDISFWVSLSILRGILLESVDLFWFREEIIASISALDVEVFVKGSWQKYGQDIVPGWGQDKVPA